MSDSMATPEKVRMFPCEQCGADVRWNPGSSMLKCPYCGHEKAVAVRDETISERSIDEPRAARDLGWGTERKSIKCQRCGAVSSIAPNIMASACAFCGTAAVVEVPPNRDMIRPEGLLPFKIERNRATEQFRGWLGGLWFRPNDLSRESNITAIQGVYIPFWTFDAATDSWWTADAGYYYYVEVEDTDSDGNRVTRSEQRTDWRRANGRHEDFFDDLPVPASRGIEPDLTRRIEPFPTDALIPYEPAFLSGFLAEEYAIDLDEALASAKERMNSELYDACSREVPGDTQRNLHVETTFSGIAYKNALLPIWIAAYQYHGTPYRFLVNGVTGAVSGKAPYSAVKIFFAVVGAIILLIILMTLFGGHHR
jgi:DNA-directed RNA polymerase subunit RPC12/RpoP